MRFYVVAGGTMVHVRPHFALCAPAFGRVGAQIAERLASRDAVLLRTSMASGGESCDEERTIFAAAGIDRLETNDDLGRLLDHLVADSRTRCIVLAAAVCDWVPVELTHAEATTREFGKDAPRLRTAEGATHLQLAPSDKLIGRVRRERDDVFLVAFKATAGLEPDQTCARGLGLLEGSGANLVLANDVQRGTNIVVTAVEEPHYAKSRGEALDRMTRIMLARIV